MIQVEPTPNPESLKFLSEKTISTIGVEEFQKTNIDKVFIKGRYMKFMFEKLSDSKKGRVLSNKSQIIDLLRNDLNNNDSLMVKASNATGFKKILKEIKGVD